jgi:hypothetical protein
MNLRLGFLNADDIGVLLFHPLEKPFTCRRPYTIGVEADNAKQAATPVS